MTQADDAHVDFETASACDLTKAGVYRYAEHPSTRAWGFCWRLGAGQVHRWMPGFPDPTELLQHLARGGRMVAHNAPFERVIWNAVLRGRYGLSHWPVLHATQQSCTMARAQSMNLPAKLEMLAKVLDVPNQKDMDGNAAMRKLMRPRNVRVDGLLTWWDGSITKGHEVVYFDDPRGEGAALLERNMVYCEGDVLAECDIDKALPPLSEPEQELWAFDQLINERGVLFDIPTVERAAELVDVAKKDADRKMRKLTGGAVRKVSEVAKLAAWLNEVGVPCEAVNKGAMKHLVFSAEVAGNTAASDAIALRKAASKTSTAKYAKMMQCHSEDGRIRGMLGFHVASTGRWGGRLVQPQNFPRFDDDNPTEKQAVSWLVELLNGSDTIDEVYQHMDVVHGDVLAWLSKALRSMMVASPGHRFLGGDFSNIEGRANTWLAGERWKLDAFVQYDEGTGPDLYKLAYAGSFGLDVSEVDKSKRQIGKVQELASGYQGGVGAYLSMADTYDLDVFTLASTVANGATSEQWHPVQERYSSATDKHGLREFEWTALKLLVTGWRNAHPMVVQSWWDYQDAAIAAVDHPGDVVDVASVNTSGKSGSTPGRVRFMSDEQFLYCCLPSGRVLSYAQPWLEYETVTRLRNDGSEYETSTTKLRHWGVDSYTKKWSKLSLYGGLLCENIVQAVSRDLLVESMFRVEKAGYPIVLTVHDEILSEPREGFGSVDEFKDLMAVLPTWANGLPLAVAAWDDRRYVK